MDGHIYVSHIDEEESYIHANGVLGSDYTLCGCDIYGDETLGWVGGVDTHKKIDCPRCIEVIRYCKKIKRSEYKHGRCC